MRGRNQSRRVLKKYFSFLKKIFGFTFYVMSVQNQIKKKYSDDDINLLSAIIWQTVDKKQGNKYLE